jgi:large subunit ribosomal protein L9
MAKNVKLLLTESVDTLGIVGDVVNVRIGYARNFLLPRNLATEPSQEAVQAVAAKRAEAERQLAELRKEREAMIKKIDGMELHMTRSCNDQGILYGAVTQQDIATAMAAAGHPVRPRDVRLTQAIKRIDTYDVHIKLDADLDAVVKLWVVADRKLDLDKARHDEETPAPAEGADAATEAAPAEGETAEAGKGKEPKAKDAKPKEKNAKLTDEERKAKKARNQKPGGAEGGAEQAKADQAPVPGVWGKPVDKGPIEGFMPKPRRSRRD